jgi:hypothetical protein
MNKPRILLIDIETAPILAHVWKIWDENIGLNQIKSHSHLLSFAAKWLDGNEIFYEDQSGRKNIEDDTQLLKSIWKLLDEADIVIVQNGVAFDIPTIKARMMAKGIPPPSPFRTIDTLTQARKHFKFTSNKLEFLAEVMGCRVRKDKHKEFPGFDLWRECLSGNQKAWRDMRKYNIDDILVLQDVYLKMRPWIDSHPNVGIFFDSDRPLCPKCANTVERRGTRYTNAGHYQQYHCNKCGGYSRGRTLLDSNKKTHLSN